MTDVPHFYVNPAGPIAVYLQIEYNIRFAIVSGRLRPGDPLPSVRDLASSLDVNPNTVTKAYRDLELMKIIVTRRGVGVRIAEGAKSRCKRQTLMMVESHLRDAVAECAAAGIPKADITKLVNQTLSSGRKPYQG